MDAICGKLRIARKKLGFKTAKEFAINHNILASTYSMHESGRKGLRLKVTQNYCMLLKIEINWLLTGNA